jgi:homoserine kinase
MPMFTPYAWQVPATTANLGPGFDTLGIALDLFNDFTVAPSDHYQLSVSANSTVDVSGLMLDAAHADPSDNLIFKAFNAYAKHYKVDLPPVHIGLTAHVPLARGLGSSSTAIVAGLQAAAYCHSQLTGQSALSGKDLLSLATALEGHPDNVAPALLHGVQLCTDVECFTLPWPPAWRLIFMVPPYPLSTHKARQVLPPHYSLQQAVANVRYTGLLVHALHTGNPHAMALALNDCLHQPYRQQLLPEWTTLHQLSVANGAMGCVISGAGPTLAIVVHQDNYPSVEAALDQWISIQTEHAYKRLDLHVLSPVGE